MLTKQRPCSFSTHKTNITHFLFLHVKFYKHTQKVLRNLIFERHYWNSIQCQFSSCAQHCFSSDFLLQRAGLLGATGPYAARNVAAESRCAAELASPRTQCAREQWRKDGPATLSLALVRQPVILVTQLGEHLAAGAMQ